MKKSGVSQTERVSISGAKAGQRGDGYHRGEFKGDTHDVSLLLLRQGPGSGAAADRGAGQVYICDECVRPVPRDHRGRAVLTPSRRIAASKIPTPREDLRATQPVRHRAGSRQEDALASPSTTTTSASTPGMQIDDVELGRATSCWSARPAAARRCWRRRWPRCWMCPSASPTPPR